MSERRKTLTRRRFVAGAASAVSLPYFVPSSILGRAGAAAPSERVTIGVVGTGGMGRSNTRGFLRQGDAQVVAVCDVDKEQLKRGAEEVAKHGGPKDCAAYSDYRELIAHSDLDAVCVATPDHWHAICCVAAADAKKDIYCQKPMTHTFAEGQAVVAAAKRNNIIFQVGSQQRSRDTFRRAVEVVRNGHIGRIKHVEVGLPTGHQKPHGEPKDALPQEPPAHADYDFWCGPAAKLPFIPARFHFHWRWHLAYGGGQLMDWIGHHNDIAHWGLDLDDSGPAEVQAKAFEYPEDRTVYNSAWKYEVWCKYAGGLTISIANHHERGCRWIGEDGWVFVSRGRFAASNPSWTAEDFDAGAVKVYHSPEHHRNFLDGVKTRKPCICTAEIGHRSITPGHLGLVSEALGKRRLRWDPKTETVIGDAEADRLLKRVDYRSPWSLA